MNSFLTAFNVSIKIFFLQPTVDIFFNYCNEALCYVESSLFKVLPKKKFIMCHIWTTGKLFIDSYNSDRDNLWDKIFFGNIPPSVDIYFNYNKTYWCLLNWLLQKKKPYVPYLKKGEITCKMIPSDYPLIRIMLIEIVSVLFFLMNEAILFQGTLFFGNILIFKKIYGFFNAFQIDSIK